ncbi:hypothetical protein AC249_AIPGENE4890 [Exaiptasia diaphana]|nr:hypothetical protein AC249_AIPGENE4890 [Exaiptasia diaphana]
MLGMVMCRLIFSANICCSIVVSSSLATFSIYSCFILRKPNTAKLRRAVLVSVFISWLWGLALSLPFSVVAKIAVYPLCKGGEHISCNFRRSDKAIRIYVGIATFVSRLLVPFAVMILLYGVLLVKIKNLIGKSQGNIVNQESTGRAPAIENHEDQNIQQDPTEERHAEEQQEQQEEQKEDGTTNEPLPIINELENKLRRIIYWIVIIYLICYAPDHFTYLSWRFD